ncbi:MAG: phosphoribosyl-AMP cyclohydrolase [Pseudomonadota bacterium]|nr:phosphoribosyl-AMP cyclohydrolase [Pseudomonadota bacterium]
MISYLYQVAWNEQGLIPAIKVDATPEKLLMQARLSREAPATAVAEQRAGSWSRSRAKLWRKDERFGNAQRLLEIRLDGEADWRHRLQLGWGILLLSATGK